MFGNYLCVGCANLPSVSVHNQFTNTKFTRPNTNILKSRNKEEGKERRTDRPTLRKRGAATAKGKASPRISQPISPKSVRPPKLNKYRATLMNFLQRSRRVKEGRSLDRAGELCYSRDR